MRFLVIGLGSMGKRRIRCLKSLDYQSIKGFDLRPERRKEAKDKYDIDIVDKISAIDFSKLDAMIISTPPDHHNEYLKIAIKKEKSAFVEASVLLDHVKEIWKLSQKKPVFIAPSCTMKFHPFIKDLKEIVGTHKYGKIANYSYHTGQYLPDWHPWESVKDFYVSHRPTGGGREIVPFELTWIVDALGYPEDIKGYFENTIKTGAQIEDSYAFVLKNRGIVGAIVVDVASRFATRSLILNFEKAQLRWNWEDGFFSVYEAEKTRWIRYFLPEKKAVEGYNKNIHENMYIEEIQTFIMAVKGEKKFPNTLEDDIRVLELLNRIEISDGGF